jgi:hypothetical protein
MSEEIEYKGFIIRIENDEDAVGPFEECDELGNYVCFHRRYNLGTKHNFNSPDDLRDFLAKEKPPVQFNLYLYDHSGITISSSSFSCPWDSGQVGVAYATRDEILKWYKRKKLNKLLIEEARNTMQSMLETYDYYLTGSVYWYSVVDSEGEDIDSCGGFYGHDHEKSGLLEHAKAEIDAYIKNNKT